MFKVLEWISVILIFLIAMTLASRYGYLSPSYSRASALPECVTPMSEVYKQIEEG